MKCSIIISFLLLILGPSFCAHAQHELSVILLSDARPDRPLPPPAGFLTGSTVDIRSIPEISETAFEVSAFLGDERSRGQRLLDISTYTITVQVIGMGILLSMDREATGFDDPHIRNVFRGLTSAPVVDKDHWVTNYIGHPAWGSETYLRARTANFSQTESFLYSTAASVFFEYFVESWSERPSRQDLIATSTIGSFIGELRFMALESLKDRSGTLAGVARIILDPIYLIWSQGPVVVRF